MALDLILDCDPGHDDAVALAVAAHRGRLLGVTTVAGNVGLEHTTRNALAIVQMLGIDVDVHSGAAAPLCGEPVDHATHVHGENGLAGATLPALRRRVASADAAGFLVDITRRAPGCVDRRDRSAHQCGDRVASATRRSPSASRASRSWAAARSATSPR